MAHEVPGPAERARRSIKEGPVAAIIENVVDIERSPEDVFDYLADQGNEPEWNPDCVSMEKLTDGPVGVGTKFRAKWKQGPVVFTEVIQYERPRAWTYVNGGSIGCTLTVTLEPASRGTRLTSRGVWSASGLARLFFPVFIRTMRKAEVGVMTNARLALEQHRDRAAAPEGSSDISRR
jgi:uncharacterized protein YndB with AHSA1/START domain